MKSFTVIIPYPPKSKARPRVTKNGTFMPKNYVEWKKNVAEVLALQGKDMEGNVEVAVTFGKQSMIVSVTETTMTRFGQGDIDNQAGSVLDALQDSGCISNDHLVVSLMADYQQQG